MNIIIRNAVWFGINGIICCENELIIYPKDESIPPFITQYKNGDAAQKVYQKFLKAVKRGDDWFVADEEEMENDD